MPRQLQIICILAGIGVLVSAVVLLLREPAETNAHRAVDEDLKAGLLVYEENCQTCHEPFLRAGYCNINAPLIHSEIYGGDGAHAVDEQQRRMVRGIEGLSYRTDIAADAGGCLIVGGEDSFDFMMRLFKVSLGDLAKR